MTPERRRAILLLLRVPVVLGALWFLARGVAWSSVAATLRGARPVLLLVVIAVNGAMMAVKAVRLRVLLAGAASFRSCFLAKLTASAMNNVMPFRGGDMARLWMLERHAQISKAGAAAIAILEALFELATLAALALAGGLMLRTQRWAVGASLVLGAAALALLVISRRLDVADKAQGSRVRRWVRGLAARLEPGVRALRQPGVVAQALALSTAAWLLEVLMVVLCARAVRLPISAPLATVVLLAINVALAVPSSPAGAGAFEGAVVVVLTLAGAAKAPAVAFALLYHLVQVVPVTLAGALVVWRAGLTLDRLPAGQSPVTSAMARPSHPFRPTV